MEQLIDQLEQLGVAFVMVCCASMIAFSFLVLAITSKLDNIAKAIRELKK